MIAIAVLVLTFVSTVVATQFAASFGRSGLGKRLQIRAKLKKVM
jgi:hypothetical protein